MYTYMYTWCKKTCSFCFDGSAGRDIVRASSPELPFFFSVSPEVLLLVGVVCGLVLTAVVCTCATVGHSGGVVLEAPGLTIPDDNRGSLRTLLTTVIAVGE